MIHEVFRARATERPDAIALAHSGGGVTYAELDRMSDEIALELSAAGVGKGNVVPVVLPVSPELVATLLAVLKCGAAYAALDPSWPAERFRRIEELLPGQVWVPRGGENPPPLVDETAAMVFFTSGSTGEPKAVVSPHEATIRLFQDCTFATFDHTTVMPQVSAVPWDAFALELWGVLLTGGTCVLVEDRPLLPGSLRELVSRHGVNTLFLTTSLFQLVVEEDVDAFAGLRTVITGGEKLSAWHARRFRAARPEVRLVNGYGPVESAVFVLTHDVTDLDGEVPLGRPVTRTSVHVVAEDGRECAPGEVGELVVAGDGLALEYLGDPGLTAEKFTWLPLGGSSVRVYRTGDRGSVDADGVFHFHGRQDRQVKVRGHRIEPAGIEHVAGGVVGVRRCVVVPVPDETGACRALALFYAGDAEQDVVAARLRADLPAYSVPDHVVRVPAFPLSANGKADARALLASLPQTGPVEVTGGSVADVVAREFAALVGSAERDRSFFELGGTSLAAVRLCTRLGARFGRSVPVSRLRSTPTAAGLAEWLSEPVEQARGRGPVLTPMQHSFLVRHQVAGGDDPYNHCPLVWTVTGDLDVSALAEAVQDVHQRHGYLHARYTDDDEPLAVPGDAVVELERLTGDRATLDARLSAPLDLEAGVPWRAVLVRSGAVWLFGVAVHHIAFDGWSRHRLADDLSAAYRARVRGAAPDFGLEVPVPAETSSAVEGLARAADVAAQRAFWAEELAGMPDLVLREGDGGADYATEHPVAVEAVDRIARERGTSRLAVLVDAVARAVAAHTGQVDFGIGVPVTQRSTEALELPVGCLIDTVCVRVGPGRSAAEAVAGALAHADLPFAEVARLHGPVRTGRHPRYQVIAAVQDAPEPVLDLPGCHVEWHDEPTPPLAELQVELVAPAGGAARLRVSRDAGRVAAEVVSAVSAAVLEAISR
ncbi:AMP-binding protein [Saccharothrix variisporea]|uniref:Amino acid adenylation domain-containing protein n=1 Tax=Saccharothrix variisporea TaxID=543527 RepID=A0A495X0M9_9PSEU|nr:AMP-binding protein [Saccharothrix variisporea]RKT67512.1 amino acid adenylation domain-containing protein [Saccharothrix variisporea]